MFPWYWRILFLMTFLPLGILMCFILIAKGLICRMGITRRQRRSKPANGLSAGPKKLLFLAYMTDENASARHRVYNFIPHLTDFDCRVFPPAPESSVQSLFAPWKPLGHYRYFLLVFFRRFFNIWSSSRYDAVFLQREIVSEFFYDPPLFIFALWLNNPRIVYDVDDVIWMIPPHSVRSKSRLLNTLAQLRFSWNVRLSRHVIVSNRYLLDKVQTIHDRVTLVPTLLDVAGYPKAVHENRPQVTIGWIGGGGNLPYLNLIAPTLRQLSKGKPFVFKIISSRPLTLGGVSQQFVRWEKKSASKALSTLDIGVMPLPDNPYTRGKGGFKLLEYMAAGVPAVASPVGVNSILIQDGETGFLASNQHQWQTALSRLIDDIQLRRKISSQALDFVSRHYDYQVWKGRFRNILSSVVNSGNR
jgi:glycosyltransferase involved in cell wall biosynthesis